MGGFGSGRQGSKAIVENCLVLSADELTRDRLLGSNLYTWTYLPVRTGAGEAGGYIHCQVDTRNPGHDSIRLRFYASRPRELSDSTVLLTTTTTPWRALRWWFICPITRSYESCGKRVGKLYLPPGERYFGCRHCYNLTYRSCNESHQSEGFFNKLAASFRPGVTGADLIASLKPYR